MLSVEVVVADDASPRSIVAVHVHHGLSTLADDWVAHCEREVAALRSAAGLGGERLRLVVRRLDHRPAVGESIEAWAREGRYAALRSASVEAGASRLLLGHHRRDQAETFLLQAAARRRLARACGHAGLRQRRGGVDWVRPWLHLPREAIEAYVAGHGIAYIDDDSNGDRRYARNRLRLEAWPALSTAFDQAEKAFAASAGWMQQASDALDELAALDLAHVAAAREGLARPRDRCRTPGRAQRRPTQQRFAGVVDGASRQAGQHASRAAPAQAGAGFAPGDMDVERRLRAALSGAAEL